MAAERLRSPGELLDVVNCVRAAISQWGTGGGAGRPVHSVALIMMWWKRPAG